MQGEELFELGLIYHRFLLDRDGNLWYWEDFPDPFFSLFIIFFTCSGLVAGILVTLILARLIKRKAKGLEESHSISGQAE